MHGGLLDCHMWDEQFDLLAKTHRVLRYDASAHGQSTLPPDVYWDHADLRELMITLEIDRAILVGLSLGGRIAIDLALEEPDRVEAIVAVSSGLSGYRFESEPYLAHRDAMIQAWRAGESMRWRRSSSDRGPTGPIVRPRMSTRRCGRRCVRWRATVSSTRWKDGSSIRRPSSIHPSPPSQRNPLRKAG